MNWSEALLKFIVDFVPLLVAVLIGMCGIGFLALIKASDNSNETFGFIGTGVMLIALSVLLMNRPEARLYFIVEFLAPLIAWFLGMGGIAALGTVIINVSNGFIKDLKDLKISLAFIAVGVILIALSVLYFWALRY